MKLTFGILALLMVWLITSPSFAIIPHAASTLPGQQAEQQQSSEPSAQIVYKNTKYGFNFSLPRGWTGYTILVSNWEGGNPEKGDVERGPVITIRHPRWTKETPRQDIPIMIFTLAQWASLEHGNLAVGTESVGPAELGRNRKYVFALAPRLHENSDVAGIEDVNEILRHDPLHPFWSK
jgi:hypothetical protein